MSDVPGRFDPEWASAAEHALYLHSLGLQVVPALKPKKGEQWKRPAIEWKALSQGLMSDEQALAYFGEGGSHRHAVNIGILTGKACRIRILDQVFKVVVIDLDTYKSAKAASWWKGLLEVHNNGMDLETVTQRTGGGGWQFLFCVPEEWQAPTCKFPELGVDIRGDGGFIVCAPSQHESGAPYKWVEGYAPWEFDIEVAPQWILDEIDRLVSLYGGRGAQAPRERIAAPQERSLGGFLTDGREQLMQDMVWAQCVDLRVSYDKIKDIPDLEDTKNGLYDRYFWQVKSRIPGVPTGDGLEREGRGRSEFERKWSYAMAQWDTGLKNAASERPQPAPKDRAALIDPDTGEEVKFDPDTGEIIEERDEWDMQPVPNVFDPWDDDFIRPPFPLEVLPTKLARAITLMAASTGGDINAVAMSALTAMAGCIDQEFRVRVLRTGNWTVPIRLWTTIVGNPSARKTPIMNEALRPLRAIEHNARKEYARAVKRRASLPKDEQGEEPPLPPRYTTNSATPEKLIEILSRQNRGILQVGDEMSSFFGGMNKYSKGDGDAGIWTQAYNGSEYNHDRVARGEKAVDNFIINFLGGLQPDAISSIKDFAKIGLLQRFIWVPMARSNKPQEITDEIGLAHYETLCTRLSTYKPVTLQPSPEAWASFDEMRRWVFEFEHSDALSTVMEGYIGKLTGLHASIAGLLHLIAGGWDRPVTGQAAEAAAVIVKQFIFPTAYFFFERIEKPESWETTLSLAEYILAGDFDTISPRDLTRNMWAFRGITAGDMARRASPLVAGGWLCEITDPKTHRLRGWEVTPGLREVFAERRVKVMAIRKRKHAELVKMREGAKNRRDISSTNVDSADDA